MDAFDADVLIYAIAPGHPLGRRVAALFLSGQGGSEPTDPVGTGSLLLLPEVLSKPYRDGNDGEVEELGDLLERLVLRPLDRVTAELASSLGATYRLRAPDSVHLATAVRAGADRFITNNRRDFPMSITEVAVTYPEDLPDPA